MGRLNTTSPSPAELVPLLCRNCGLPLEGDDEAALFLCSACGLVYEPGDEGLAAFQPLTATITSELAIPGDVRYLAIWRFVASPQAGVRTSQPGPVPDLQLPADPAWEGIRKAAAPGPPYLYVPAFVLTRAVVQQLGVGLVMAQPQLELSPGLPAEVPARPKLVAASDGASAGAAAAAACKVGGDVDTDAGLDEGPGFETISPVAVGRQDARALANFVYLAVVARELHDLLSIDYHLDLSNEELVFLPAAWDRRYVLTSSWRFLLREFDDLVA